jgi:hypothetical protein
MLNDKGRIPKAVVTDIEALLDAEYVPFYFHDLRTNEVIGFHAFLNSLDDSYSISASTESAFGRLDGVKIYSGTTRSISFGFVIAATSENDFDEMWFRINKLVTLVYPQWTPGDEVVGAQRPDGSTPRYKVPFSQVISSSPLIRVRIGDVISSNYSKFGLSRFFGATDENTVLDTDARRKTRFDDNARQGKKEDDRYYPPGSLSARSNTKIRETSVAMPVIIKPSMGKNYLLEDGVSTRPIKVNFPIRGEISNVKLGEALIKQKSTDGFVGLAPDAQPLLYIDVTVTDDRYVGDIQGKTIKLTRADFVYDVDRGPGVKPELEAGLDEIADTLGVNDFTSFFDSATNPVVRAFESTQGKGLAGMITTLKFTWLDENNTWEVTRGSRAPMWCRVDIGMDVVHDLPLGMGHDGFMIAPAYPVGNVNRRFFGTQYTSPDKPYSVPIAGGNVDLENAVKDPRVINNSALSPEAAASGAARAVGG